MNSIWTENIVLPHFDTIEGDVNTDVLIIGGGIAGILCAFFLQEKGVDYVLVEGRTICKGTTENTTAKITAQHGLIYHKLLNSLGAEKTKMYLEANQNAVEKYFELCKNIDCDFEEKTAYVYSIDNRRKLEEEARALETIGYSCDISQTSSLPFSTVGAIGFLHQAQFHPLKLISQIAKNLKIYENSFVRQLTKNTAITDKSNIRFKKVIFATHFPIDNKHGMYFLKLHQHRSYVIALENVPKVNGMYIDEAKGGMSFRNYKEYLLVGGGAHRTGKRGGNWQELRSFADKYYPHSHEKTCQATQDCMSLDGIPYIGQYSKSMPQYYVATGFNKWVMSSSMAAAMILSDMVTEKENQYAEVFSPSRSIIKPQLLYNGCEAISHLLTLSGKRCPHMGCALKWNSVEHTWDCPCHGSRFDTDGGLINNPANGDLK